MVTSKDTTDNESIPERPRGILSRSDRNYLNVGHDGYMEKYSDGAANKRRVDVRNRARAALRDFRLLADELPAEEREKIFAADPRNEELTELQDDIVKTIEFLYTGMGGESGFRKPLEYGVINGELELGNINHPFDVAPQFAVDVISRNDPGGVIDAIESEEWSRLTRPPALFSFFKLAMRADAIDFDAVRERVDLEHRLSEDLQEVNRLLSEGEHPVQKNGEE